MDPRYDPYGAGGRWAPQPGAYGPPPGAADDGLIRLGGWVLGALAVVLLAAVAIVVAGALYGVATWRRWRWWPLVLAGAGGALLVVGLGPEAALERHLLALRELTVNGRPPLGQLVSARWAAWAVAQLPLALPLGILLAGFGRHQVQSVSAHELSPRARRRREAEDAAGLRRAMRRAAVAPAEARGRPVLGAWAGGDLSDWRSGPWCVLPEQVLGLGTLVVGLPGAGKTETLLRISQLALGSGYDVHVLDAKGDAGTQDRFAGLARAMGVEALLFPECGYDGFRGDGVAIRNRLGRIIDYSEPFYQDGARDLLAAVCGAQPPRSLRALLGALPSVELEGIDGAVRRGTLSRYRSFAAAAGAGLDGDWAYEDGRASYVLLDGVALGDDAPRLARFLVEDFAHFASSRKDPGKRALLVVDEFSALRLPNAAALFERLRGFGAGVVLAAQSIEGLHDDEGERARMVNAASTLIAHRLADPEVFLARAGSLRKAERSHQLDFGGPTGAGSLRMQDSYRVDPNELRSLPAGVAYVTTGGRACKVAVAQARWEQLPLAATPEPDGGEVDLRKADSVRLQECRPAEVVEDTVGATEHPDGEGHATEQTGAEPTVSPYAQGL